ncbi:MAG: DUF6807 family protein, partial [Gemmata sp.]
MNNRLLQSLALALLLPAGASSFDDKGADANALPKVPAGFEVKVFAREPLVRQPCSMAFDAKGRLFVGMGPQYRDPKPGTPGDSVVSVEDTGVLIEESGLSVTLGLSTAQRLVIPKENIDSRRTTKKSATLSFDRQLTPSQVADVTASLVSQKAKPAGVQKPEANRPEEKKAEPEVIKPVVDVKSKFGLDLKKDRLIVTHAEKPLGEYVWGDPKVLRPYFANLHGPGGTKITRNHPPVAGADAADHDTMHPGLWLGFGDISGVDFWRNRGRIEHVKFLAPPTA